MEIPKARGGGGGEKMEAIHGMVWIFSGIAY